MTPILMSLATVGAVGQVAQDGVNSTDRWGPSSRYMWDYGKVEVLPRDVWAIGWGSQRACTLIVLTEAVVRGSLPRPIVVLALFEPDQFLCSVGLLQKVS